MTDLAAKLPAKAAELKALWQVWAQRCNVLDKGKAKPKGAGAGE